MAYEFDWKYFVEKAKELQLCVHTVGADFVVLDYDICTEPGRDLLEVRALPGDTDQLTTVKLSGRCYECDFPDLALISVGGRNPEITALMAACMVIDAGDFSVVRRFPNDRRLFSDGSIGQEDD